MQEANRARRIAVADPVLKQRAKPNENYACGGSSGDRAGGSSAAEAEGRSVTGQPKPLKTVLSHAEFRPSDEVCSAWGVSARVVRPLEQLFRGPARHYCA